MNIGTRISEIRTEKGISTNRLASIAGVSQSHLRSIEMGEKQAGVDVLEKICAALGISLADFFSENPVKSGHISRLSAIAEKLGPDQVERLVLFLEAFLENKS